MSSDRKAFYKRAKLELEWERIQAEREALDRRMKAADVEMAECNRRIRAVFAANPAIKAVQVRADPTDPATEGVITVVGGLVGFERLTRIYEIPDEEVGGVGGAEVDSAAPSVDVWVGPPVDAATTTPRLPIHLPVRLRVPGELPVYDDPAIAAAQTAGA